MEGNAKKWTEKEENGLQWNWVQDGVRRDDKAHESVHLMKINKKLVELIKRDDQKRWKNLPDKGKF